MQEDKVMKNNNSGIESIDFDALPSRKSWPFKTMAVGEVVELLVTDDPKEVAKARSASTSYGKYSGKKFQTKTSNGVLYCKRVK